MNAATDFKIKLNDGFMKLLFWTGIALASLFFAFLSFASFSEWWIVKIKKETKLLSLGKRALVLQ